MQGRASEIMKKEVLTRCHLQMTQPYETCLGAHSPLTKTAPKTFIFSHLYWAHEHVFSQVFLGWLHFGMSQIPSRKEGRYAGSRRSPLAVLSKAGPSLCCPSHHSSSSKRGREGQEDLSGARGVCDVLQRHPRSHAFLLITACLLTLTVCHSLTYNRVLFSGSITLSGGHYVWIWLLRTSLQAPLGDFQNLFRAISRSCLFQPIVAGA